MWRRTVAPKIMALTRVEREKITDTMLKIQSARTSLEDFDDEDKIPDLEGMQGCLEDADRNLRLALRLTSPKKTK
jgi:hypothetical protein